MCLVLWKASMCCYPSHSIPFAPTQPVLVSGVRKLLNERLWHPTFFNNKFGELNNDLIDCSTGNVIQGAPMKDFWDGFEDVQSKLTTLPQI